MHGAQVLSLVRELVSTCRNEDPAQPKIYINNYSKERNWVSVTAGSPWCRPSAWLDLRLLPASGSPPPGTPIISVLKEPIRSLKWPLISHLSDAASFQASLRAQGMIPAAAQALLLCSEGLHLVGRPPQLHCSIFLSPLMSAFFQPSHTTHGQRLINLQIWKCHRTDHVLKITSHTFVRSIKEWMAGLADPTFIW